MTNLPSLFNFILFGIKTSVVYKLLVPYQLKLLAFSFYSTYQHFSRPVIIPQITTTKVLSQSQPNTYLVLYSLSAVEPVLRCAQCKKNFPQATVIDNMLVSEAVSSSSCSSSPTTHLCTSCSDDAVGSCFCTDCEEWLCDACLQVSNKSTSAPPALMMLSAPVSVWTVKSGSVMPVYR